VNICACCYQIPEHCTCRRVETCPDAEIADATASRAAGEAAQRLQELDVERFADSRSPRRARA
jgi:hypothetical protein